MLNIDHKYCSNLFCYNYHIVENHDSRLLKNAFIQSAALLSTRNRLSKHDCHSHCKPSLSLKAWLGKAGNNIAILGANKDWTMTAHLARPVAIMCLHYFINHYLVIFITNIYGKLVDQFICNYFFWDTLLDFITIII